MKKSDNKGSTILMVLLVIVGVGVMAAIALWVSFRNVQMKVTDTDIKESFYSAEAILEQVKAGVQKKVEAAYKQAITEELENFSNPPATVDAGGSTDRAERFNKTFRNKLEEELYGSATTGSNKHYNTFNITDMVDRGLLSSATYPYALVTARYGTLNADIGKLEMTDNKVVLKGIRVRYVSSDEQVSEIETDITISTPKAGGVAAKAVSDVFEYSIIGNEGIKVEPGNLTVKGNVYSGSPFSKGKVEYGDKTSFVVDKNAAVSFDDKLLIANGDTVVNGSFTTGAREKFLTENIVLNGGKASLSGVSQIADDLTLNGENSSVILSGIYKGYGNSNSVAAESSAIIINGKNSSLDLSGAKEIMLAGYSYIATGNEKLRDTSRGEASQNKDIKMGESISIKGSQIGYLMPAEWIGTDEADASAFNSNPLTYAEYNKILTETETDDKGVTKLKYKMVNNTVKSAKTGKSFKDYGVITDADIDKYCSKIFVQPITGVSDEGLVYFYVNLPQDKAGNFLFDYYNKDMKGSKELDTHAKFYTSSIKSVSEAKIKTAGNYSILETSILQLKNGGGTLDEPTAYKKEFSSLCTNLTSDVTPEEQRRDVFDNIIYTDNLSSYLRGVTERVVTLTSGEKAVITSGNYDYNNSSGNVRLIVAQGNVNVKQNFTGSIIAKGKITVSGAGEISTDNAGIIKQLLREPVSEGGLGHLHKIFRDGEALSAVSKPESKPLLFEDGSIDVSRLITYTNWKKK